MENFKKAKQEADKVDKEIIEILQRKKSFRVEAGAGSGKTYSLNKVIEWLEANKKKEFTSKNQNIVCITYTNVAVEVIKSSISSASFIFPSTIHSFVWQAISQYQSALVELVKDFPRKEDEKDMEVSEVQYTLGYRYIENSVQYLHHSDVLDLFVEMMKNKKFRNIFSSKYPLILIDEYQDSYKPIIDSFIKYFIDEKTGPQFGFFGDSWQTIYQSNNACGAIEHKNIKVIKKVSNFRSAPNIVNFLNKIRPELPQYSAIDDFEGEINVITCDDYRGQRRSDIYYRWDLPAEELRNRLDNLIGHIKENKISETENLKTLMITHKVLASQQGYEQLLTILNDRLKNREDDILIFFLDVIEPIYKALADKNANLLFEALGTRYYPINRKSDKTKWKQLQEDLKKARNNSAIDVIKTAINSKLVPISQGVLDIYGLYETSPESEYYNHISVFDFLNIKYEQFLAAINFLQPEAEFSTEHGVKGDEYDNVIFTISKGWNNYKFDEYAPMLLNDAAYKNDSAYVRNRNLFYVCCSRPRKRLFIFISVVLNKRFRDFLEQTVGKENIYTYSEYINKT